MNIPAKEWGRDHWSLLAFIECLCVDHRGKLDDARRRNLRTNSTTHPGHGYSLGEPGWNPASGTRLKDKQLPMHDDWDCLEDLEAAGLLENNGSSIEPLLKLTQAGLAYSAALRAHKANGKGFATFQPVFQPLELFAQCLALKGIADSIVSKDGKRFWLRVMAPNKQYVEGEGDTLGEAIQQFATRLLSRTDQ